jgi:hypothetical protein
MRLAVEKQDGLVGFHSDVPALIHGRRRVRDGVGRRGRCRIDGGALPGSAERATQATAWGISAPRGAGDGEQARSREGGAGDTRSRTHP